MAKRLNVMISSSVHGNEQLLKRVEIYLNNLGGAYRVWLSHSGTLPTNSALSAFENCLEAVRQCDVFVGLITGNYGSGMDERGGLSITHQEMSLALTLSKQRILLVDERVVLARELLKPYRMPADQGPFRKKDDDYLPIGWPPRHPILSDLKVLDLYDELIQANSGLLPSQRAGNWVQPYKSDDDALRIIDAQLGDVKRIRKQIKDATHQTPPAETEV